MRCYDWLVVMALALLCGCQPREDLQQFVVRVKAQPVAPWQPPSSLVELPTAHYQPTERDPFQGQRGEVFADAVTERCQHHELTVNHSPLQRAALATLTMRGSIGNGTRLWALIETDDGRLHRISRGDGIGLDLGQVVNVFPSHIEILEWVENGGGCLQPREAVLALVDSAQEQW